MTTQTRVVAIEAASKDDATEEVYNLTHEELLTDTDCRSIDYARQITSVEVEVND